MVSRLHISHFFEGLLTPYDQSFSHAGAMLLYGGSFMRLGGSTLFVNNTAVGDGGKECVSIQTIFRQDAL